MKKILIGLAAIATIAVGVYFYMKSNGHTNETIINTIKNADLSVECKNLTNVLVTSKIDVTVDNISSRTHNNIKVRITAYDKNGDILKEKTTTFMRELGGHESFTKTVTLPSKTKTCNCVIADSDTSN